MARNTNEKTDAYQKVTDRMIEALEKGVAPWVCPWNAKLGLPRNGHSGHIYTGINTWMCWSAGFGDPRWYTFNQVKEYGESHVRKGEHGTVITHWNFFDKQIVEKDASGNEMVRTQRIPCLRTFTVFNYQQIEWDASNHPKDLENTNPEVGYTDAADLLKKSGATVLQGGVAACYIPVTDSIMMPLASSFQSLDQYWGTLFHELGHWTGHASRLSRNMDTRFGSDSYAAEELVAEMTSAFLCGDFGIQGKLQHESYLAHWVKMLRKDKYALFTAAKHARQAVEFLTKTSKTEEIADSDQAVA